MRKTLLTLSILIALPLSLQAEERFVERVIDGNTLKLLSGDRVTLLGIELDEESPADAHEIAEEVRDLISGSVVNLEYEGDLRDESGRLQAYVWFEYVPRDALEIIEFLENYEVKYQEDSEGFGSFLVFLNASLVKSGHAVPQETYIEGRYSELFHRLHRERDSRIAQRGEYPMAIREDVISRE